MGWNDDGQVEWNIHAFMGPQRVVADVLNVKVRSGLNAPPLKERTDDSRNRLEVEDFSKRIDIVQLDAIVECAAVGGNRLAAK